MLTVLVLAAPDQAADLIAHIEGVAEARVVSSTHDSALALARAQTLLPDVLVADLSARFAPDSATVIHRARLLTPPCTVVVHADGAVLGTIAPEGAVCPAPDPEAGALARVLAQLSGFPA
ncbi:hypothetical protein ACVHNB_19575 [Streptomyces sp. YJ-C3]